MDISSNFKKENIKTELITNKKQNIYLKNNKYINKEILMSEEEKNEITNDFNIKGLKINLEKLSNKHKKNIKKTNNSEKEIKYYIKDKLEKEKRDTKRTKSFENSKYLIKSSHNNKKHSDKKCYFRNRKYNEFSYVRRHKLEKEFRMNNYNHFKKEETRSMKNNVFIERTISEMYVLNNNGLLNDDDYEFYKKLYGYSSFNNKRNNKIKS